jgi:hypothetical protein
MPINIELLSAAPPPTRQTLRIFLLIDRNRIPSFIAFCATAPRVRHNVFAACPAESVSFANARKFFTSYFDHARTTRRFFFAITTSIEKRTLYLSRVAGHIEHKAYDPSAHVLPNRPAAPERTWTALARLRAQAAGDLSREK